MVPRRLFAWKTVVQVLLGLHAADARAVTIQFTGNMSCDSAGDRVGAAGPGWTKAPADAEQNIPEPTTRLAWRLVAGAAACRFRG